MSVTLDDIITTLTILREQLKDRGTPSGEIDELTFYPEKITLRRGLKTLTIPLRPMECIK